MGVKPHTHKIMMPLTGPIRSVQIASQWFVVFFYDWFMAFNLS